MRAQTGSDSAYMHAHRKIHHLLQSSRTLHLQNASGWHMTASSRIDQQNASGWQGITIFLGQKIGEKDAEAGVQGVCDETVYR